jgi:menaquinone-dependent protoporphyrinogen oxidase
MRILIVFATTEGHARKLAGYAAGRLTAAGHLVRVCDATQPDLPDPAGFEAAVLIASVHLGHYQAAFCNFVHNSHDALNAIPTAFVSVSLSAAGSNPSDLAGLRLCVDRLERDTLWRPVAVHHAAGAMPFSAYGFFMKLAIQFIARRRGKIVKTSEDYDLTDYAELATFVDGFVSGAIAPKQSAMPS